MVERKEKHAADLQMANKRPILVFKRPFTSLFDFKRPHSHRQCSSLLIKALQFLKLINQRLSLNSAASLAHAT